MNEESTEVSQPLIRLSGRDEEIEVEGFLGLYAAFIDENPALRSTHNIGGLLLATVGGVIAVTGLMMMMFGPDTIMVDRISGPTLSQYIQIYPGLVFSLGAFLFSIGLKLPKDTNCISPEEFLASEYKLIVGTEILCEGAYSLEYLGKDKFLVKYPASDSHTENPPAG